MKITPECGRATGNGRMILLMNGVTKKGKPRRAQRFEIKAKPEEKILVMRIEFGKRTHDISQSEFIIII